MMRKQRAKLERNQEYLTAQGHHRTVPKSNGYPVPTNLTNFDVAFGNISHLPGKTDIAEEYWQDSHPAAHAASMLFFKGGKLSDFGYTPKEGINCGMATAALGAILVSFEPKHEHKIAGVAFLIDQWFNHA